MSTVNGIGIEYKGLRELGVYLREIGVDDQEFRTVMNDAGNIVVQEARTLVPIGATGRLAQSIKANAARSSIIITAGNNTTVRYAYTFHAVALGKSKGGFTYHVPATTNRRAYSRVARIPNRPFMFAAAMAKQQAVFERFVLGVGTLIDSKLGQGGSV